MPRDFGKETVIQFVKGSRARIRESKGYLKEVGIWATSNASSRPG
jgi:hypothetical protein